MFEKQINDQHPQSSGKCNSKLLWDSSVRIAKITKINGSRRWWGCRVRECSYINGAIANSYSHNGSQKDENWSSKCSYITLHVYLKDALSYQRDTFSTIFIADLFIKAIKT